LKNNSKARATYDKLRKERDFHRMHHKRVVQEKNRLIGDIKRLKKHYESYEPTLKQLRNRYEVAMKEKMLTKLERDKLASKLSALEENVKLERQSKETSAKISKILDSEPKEKSPVKREKEKEGSASQKEGNKSSKKSAQSPKDSSLPVDDRTNPYGSMDLPVAKVDKLKQIHSVKAHSMAISS
jgi:sperm-associated antigen 16 protein